MNIKIVGDIRNGNFQPSLTGNLAVDDALIDNFSQKLRAKVAGTFHDVRVSVDHFLNLEHQSDSNSIIVIDNDISKYLDADTKKMHTMIDVNHTDILHGTVDSIAKKITDRLDMNK